MTNERAVEILNLDLDILGQYGGETAEAYKMAIQALKQQPCEDCISRESLRQKLQENYDFFVNAYGGFGNLPQSDKPRVDEIDNCIAMVVNEPPVAPKRPKGKWIRVVDKAGHWVWECDCKWQQRFATNYCPNCGAYMGGEADDE